MRELREHRGTKGDKLTVHAGTELPWEVQNVPVYKSWQVWPMVVASAKGSSDDAQLAFAADLYAAACEQDVGGPPVIVLSIMAAALPILFLECDFTGGSDVGGEGGVESGGVRADRATLPFIFLVRLFVRSFISFSGSFSFPPPSTKVDGGQIKPRV